MAVAVIGLTRAGYRDIYALCVALPKSFAEDLYECTRTLLEESVSSLCQVSKEPKCTHVPVSGRKIVTSFTFLLHHTTSSLSSSSPRHHHIHFSTPVFLLPSYYISPDPPPSNSVTCMRVGCCYSSTTSAGPTSVRVLATSTTSSHTSTGSTCRGIALQIHLTTMYQGSPFLLQPQRTPMPLWRSEM